MLSEEDAMSAGISTISLMLGSSILHIVACSQLRQHKYMMTLKCSSVYQYYKEASIQI